MIAKYQSAFDDLQLMYLVSTMKFPWALLDIPLHLIYVKIDIFRKIFASRYSFLKSYKTMVPFFKSNSSY
jgi:hypothetical protein